MYLINLYLSAFAFRLHQRSKINKKLKKLSYNIYIRLHYGAVFQTFKLQHTLLETVDLVTVPRNFWHWSVSDIDHRQIGACCACSKCGTFLFAPLMVIVLWPQYREKIAQHMLRAIAVLHFPIYALKSCPAPAALAAGAGHYFSLTAYNLTFKPPYRGKGLKKDIS